MNRDEAAGPVVSATTLDSKLTGGCTSRECPIRMDRAAHEWSGNVALSRIR